MLQKALARRSVTSNERITESCWMWAIFKPCPQIKKFENERGIGISRAKNQKS
jgi:hypothetical protein